MVILNFESNISSVGKQKEKFGRENIQKISFEICSIEYSVELNGILIRISNTNTLHIQELVQNVIRFINQEQGKDTEFAIRSEADFQAEDERGSFYKNFYRNEKMQRIYLGHKKMPMIYSDPIFRNLVSIHLLSAFSDNQDQKYLTEGCQKPFIPAHGVCLAYQTHRALSSYITKSGRILVILNMVEPTSSLTPDHFHQPLYTHQYPTLNITPLNLISRIPRRGSDSKPAFIQCG